MILLLVQGVLSMFMLWCMMPQTSDGGGDGSGMRKMREEEPNVKKTFRLY
jgi:hypothetical protein